MMNLKKLIEVTEKEDHAYGMVVGSSIAFYDNERTEGEGWIGLHFDEDSFVENKRAEKSIYFQPDDLSEVTRILNALIHEDLYEASVRVDWDDCDLDIERSGDTVTITLTHEPKYNLTVSIDQIKKIIEEIEEHPGW